MRRVIPSATALRRSKYSFRALHITIVVISAIAVLSLVADQTARYRHGDNYGIAQKRALLALDPDRVVKLDEECRLVHHASDKCAFIKANCPDEEAGLLSYLSLYYCGLQKAQLVAFIILALWLGLLFSTIGIAASDFFCINLSTMASILGMSESMAGVTFLAFGNGSPDVFSTFAAMKTNSGSLAVGELIGAAGFITAVVAGSMALVQEFRVGKKTFVRDVGFFIVAASFSMIFLADGKLLLWECAAMVGFYVFYVFTVVLWHWYLGRRHRIREREALARGQTLHPGNEELEVVEEDGDDDAGPAGDPWSRWAREDFDALERTASPYDECNSDDTDEDGDTGRYIANEMSQNMRVIRPRGARRNTITPIRPSLIGALEFRSVLSSLQKSRSMNAPPIRLRRYSDDHVASMLPEDGSSAPPSRYDGSLMDQDIPQPAPSMLNSRMRAVSMNDAARNMHHDPAAFTVANIPNIGVVGATPTFPTFPNNRASEAPHSPSAPILRVSADENDTPTVFNIPTSQPRPLSSSSGNVSPKNVDGRQPRFDVRLAPPSNERRPRSLSPLAPYHDDPSDDEPSTPTPKPKAERPKLQIPTHGSSQSRSSSPILRFPSYDDSLLAPTSARSSKPPSIILPEDSLSASLYLTDTHTEGEKPIRWWPYRFLPSPQVLTATLFPAMYTWKHKGIWDKIIALASTPSIFLLAITLPVVEPEPPKEEEIIEERQRRRSRSRSVALVLDSPSLASGHQPLLSEWPGTNVHQDPAFLSPVSPSTRGGLAGHGNSAGVAVSTENLHEHLHTISQRQDQGGNGATTPAVVDLPPEPPTALKDWNRWLVVVQIFTAPLFTAFIIWANTTEDSNPRGLIRPVLYCLLGSFVVLAILLLTTSPDKPPKYRFLFCFLGFAVSIAWISTIANEVVGVLKALGVILNISDAILGLTIFAVGNSLGDLVADITVARLGYPVMALSACFGGPMLNILLGIGLSGLYMTITEAHTRHHEHPNKKFKYKPYEVEVSGTLMVSAITLLVTLVGLLIMVPLNKWVMSRRIGFTLICLWVISTVINLVVEITGVWEYFM